VAEEEVGLRLSLKERRAVAKGLGDTQGELQDVAETADEVGQAGKRAERGLLAVASGKVKSGLLAVARGGRSVVSVVGRGILGASKVGVAGLTALSVAAAGVSVKAISLAGDAAETASAFNTVFGPSARGVQKDLNRLTRQFGIYNPELQDATRQFGVFGKAAGIAKKELPGFSTDLTKAGLDLASFYNQDPGEVFQALQSGLSGEAEPLRKFGIFISDAAMKAKAAEMGLTGTLTEQQKVMVRHKLILGSLGDAQGDLARTSGGLANQQRGAEGRIKSFFTLLGGPMATAATGFFRGFNSVAKVAVRELRAALPGMESSAESLSTKFARWGRQLAHQLPGAIDTTVDRWDSLKSRFDGFSLGQTQNQVGQLADDVRDLGPVFEEVGRQLPGISDMLEVTGVVTGFLADHTDLLAKAVPYLIIGYGALKVSQLAANVVLAASLPLKVAELITNRQLTKSNAALVASRTAVVASTVAETAAVTANTGAHNVGLLARARATAGAIAHSAATKAIALATGIWTGAQWLLNAALTANPIGLVVAGIAALVGGFILAYKKSETFRSGVDFVWNKVLKPFGSFIGDVFVGYFRLLASAYLMMARVGIKAFTWLLKAAFSAFDGILSAAEKGMGWVPGIGDKIKGARRAFDAFGDATIDKLDALGTKLKGVQDRVDNLGRDRSATITINTVRSGDESRPRGVGGAAPRARGGPVIAGRPYIVGEHRPELFVPEQSGTIVPRVPSRLTAAAPLSLPSDELDLDEGELTVGPAWPGGPIVIQLMLPNGRVLGEAVLDDLRSQEARL